MSRSTVTLTAPNGAKVRTVHSKRYFVVRYGDLHVKYDRKADEHVRLDPPEPFASVAKRTDSVIAAARELSKCGQAVVIAVSDDGEFKHTLTPAEVSERVVVAKQREASAARRGNQGEARRLWY